MAVFKTACFLLALAVLKFGSAQEGSNCVCVPYYQCKDGHIITSGEGLIDIRSGFTNPCTSVLDVCCIPPSEETLEPYTPHCGQRNNQGIRPRITTIPGRNSDTQYGEFPWQVAILAEEYDNNNQVVSVYQCGGSLIHEQAVLTAAHCVYDIPPEAIKIRAGSWDILSEEEPYQERKVAERLIRPDYKHRVLYNDLAILILEFPLTLEKHVDTVCLPSHTQSFPDGSNCVVSGWGKHAYGDEGNYQRIMKKVNVPLVNHYECADALRTTRLGRYFRLHRSFRCAGGKQGEDACEGDGGSALVCESEGYWFQVGIVAWGIGCGENAVPGVYADVTQFTNWIRETLEIYFGHY